MLHIYEYYAFVAYQNETWHGVVRDENQFIAQSQLALSVALKQPFFFHAICP